jgi:hypothetical protein
MKKYIPAFMLLIFTLAFSGCEMPPEPVKISEVQYSHLTCDQISQEQLRIKAALAAARDAQRSRSDYGMGGNFNGITVTSKSSGLSEIDKLKEELQALQQAAIQKSCPAPRVPDSYLPDESPK